MTVPPSEPPVPAPGERTAVPSFGPPVPTSGERPVPDPVSGAGPTPETPTAPGAGVSEATAPPVSARVPRNRAADRAAVRAFRPRRVVPATITAALMTVAGALVAAEVISALLGRPLRWIPYDRLLSWASSTTWDDPSVTLGAALITLLGLLLVLLALVPGRPRLIPVRTDDPDLVIGMQPRGFIRALAHAAEQVPGVDHARVRLRGRTAEVTARSPLREPVGLAEAVQQAVTTRIAALAPLKDHPVRVHLRGK
ncbi:DUF6286 domain-containing protein [Streptosporangium carneum]|uniref:DUF6286 domain-containing protein n=1 Tax=Streptosporangium carneum TaxID=47481 RepID=A0A9W6I7R5_9ACTN|nr:DUF6286 domain-containing protein [Streptosporangium carneum]GLK13650.1 hypothetical protein GCM10017600_70610 [Streptosporangium carneum]